MFGGIVGEELLQGVVGIAGDVSRVLEDLSTEN